jgi:nicotinamide phosphoribosyltransferase
MDEYNPILYADAYKISHPKQYPGNLMYLNSYLEARVPNINTVFFGMQMLLQRYMSTPITKEMVDEAEKFWTDYGIDFSREGWDIIVNEYEGKLPLHIQAVPEGTRVPTGNVLVQVTNTDSRLPWLVNFVETMLMSNLWYPTTVATVSFGIKCLIKDALDQTGCEITDIILPYKLNDFGFRGVSSKDSAGIGGAAHLTSFDSSDNAEGLIYAMKYYNASIKNLSINAAEHSTIGAWGEDGEIDAYQNMIDAFFGEGKIVACVSDTYNLWNAIDMWGTELKDQIIESGACLVVRPDSGDPVEISLLTIKSLAVHFGYTTNEKGYKVLPDCIRVIYGDGINMTSIAAIINNIINDGWAAENITFGMGGALLQQVNRDTFGFTYKACEGIYDTIEGEVAFDIYKDPITSGGSKTSKRGRLALIINEEGKYETIREDEMESPEQNILEDVYLDGEIVKEVTFDAIRETINKEVDAQIALLRQAFINKE